VIALVDTSHLLAVMGKFQLGFFVAFIHGDGEEMEVQADVALQAYLADLQVGGEAGVFSGYVIFVTFVDEYCLKVAFRVLEDVFGSSLEVFEAVLEIRRAPNVADARLPS
jgi:hypothetical protein